MSTNLRTALIFGGFITLIGAAFYPIYFRPLMRLEEYQKEQAINRAGVVQEDVQPPGSERAVPPSDEEGRPRPSESSGFQFCSRCPEELTWPVNNSRRRKLLKALEKSAGQQL
uniref:Small integral membrane protein 20 n=1 Tax=Sus scrofa TaxID=9823 RepID=A0A287AK36_PIG